MNLKNCIPKDKHDLGSIGRANRIGFPALNPIIPELLEWVADANWPVARGVGGLLSNAGLEIVPHVKTILKSEDWIWKLWTVELVLNDIRFDVLAELHEDIERLANYPTSEEQLEKVDIAARELIADRLQNTDQ